MTEHPEPVAAEPISGMDGFIRVSEAKERYFGGAMSLRWWYRQIEQGRLTHYRAGGSVLLRKADVEAFVSAGLRTTRREEPTPPPPEPSPPPKAKPRSPPPGGLRFFGD
jgi:excisionase family DNA binding protein